jgi:hypothetical protein
MLGRAAFETAPVRWPYHPAPLPDELLSSWLTRIALGHGMSLTNFARAALGGPIWTRDIDMQAPQGLIEAISIGTGVLVKRVVQTTFLTEDVMSTRHPVEIAVMPLSNGSGKRRTYGLQYCHLCILDDHVAYYRKAWRLAVSTICPRHGVYLSDACDICDRPIRICTQQPPTHKNIALRFVCTSCGGDLQGPSKAAPDELVHLHNYLMNNVSSSLFHGTHRTISSWSRKARFGRQRVRTRSSTLMTLICKYERPGADLQAIDRMFRI